uniref:Transposase n=1 Tax=Echinococcus granulosus TaxID=6210 RepID=A0A068WT25_ECHGR|nr:hypothetical protein EgrG_000114300 [Echinococcus granulosus]
MDAQKVKQHQGRKILPQKEENETSMAAFKL